MHPKSSRRIPLNAVLWILQALLGSVFLIAGITQIVMPKPKLAPRQAWVEDYSPISIKLIGVAEIVAATGVLILPLLDIVPWIVPLAALAMAGILTGAFFAHRRRKESRRALAVIALRVIALIVVVGRMFISPL
jgi:uncharacterized membrane protein YphA (DoxX/SURF4 family)